MKYKSKTLFTKYYVVMILALFSCFLWGSAFPSVKKGYELFSISSEDTFGKISFAGFRFFFSSIMIFLFCLFTKRKLTLKKESFYKLLLLGLIQTTLQYFFFYIGLSYTSGTKGSILSATSTFFSVIIAHFYYKEDRLNHKKVIGVVLGFIGVTLVNLGGSGIEGGFSLTGDGFVIISSLTAAISGIYTKKITKDIDVFLITGYQLFLGSLFLIATGWIGGGNIEFTQKGFGLLLYMGFISAAAFSLWTILLKYNGVGKVTIYKFTIPLFGVFLSYLFLGERLLGMNGILSLLLVVLSIILLNLPSNNHRDITL